MTMVMMIVVAVAVVSTPLYTVTMFQLQTIHTIQTNIPVKITFEITKRKERIKMK